MSGKISKVFQGNGKAIEAKTAVYKPNYPLSYVKVFTPKEADHIQAIYLAIFERYQMQTPAIARSCLHNQFSLSCDDGKPAKFSVFRGIVANVKCDTKVGMKVGSEDKILCSAVIGICLMFPEMQDYKTNEWHQIDTHLWLYLNNLDCSMDSKHPEFSICLGDTLKFYGTVIDYANGSGRKGIGKWLVDSSAMLYTYGRRILSVPRNVISHCRWVKAEKVDDERIKLTIATKTDANKDLYYLRSMSGDVKGIRLSKEKPAPIPSVYLQEDNSKAGDNV